MFNELRSTYSTVSDLYVPSDMLLLVETHTCLMCDILCILFYLIDLECQRTNIDDCVHQEYVALRESHHRMSIVF
jgi:hypothetical protein